MKSLEELFWAKVEKSDSCWVWNGAVSKNGYGNFITAYNRGRTSLPHRLSLEFAGVEINEGMVVDHTCRNRRCVNPSHLEPVSQKENVLRERAANGESRVFRNQNSGKEFCVHGHSDWRIEPNRRTCMTCKRNRR